MRKQLIQLQKTMIAEGINIYYIPSMDFHGSEYVGEYFQFRKYISGFTGSAGTLIVTQKDAYLWTDGRYFTQAKLELANSGITPMKMGQPDVPTVEEWLEAHLFKGDTLALDGRCLSATDGIEFEKIATKKCAFFMYDKDMADLLWTYRPSLSKEPVWVLEDRYSGMTCADKLDQIRAKLPTDTDNGTNNNAFLFCALDDIAWTLNLRGNDIAYCPLFLSYLIISKDMCILYADKDKFNADITNYLLANNIELRHYFEIYKDVENLNYSIVTDYNTTNYTLERLARSRGNSFSITDDKSIILQLKSVKNKIECDNIEKAHIKDGVALVRFMKWLKESISTHNEACDNTSYDNEKTYPITELSAAVKLDEFRKEQSNYIEPSFEPIMGYGEHGAIIHYSATDKTNVPLEPKGFLLSDTGAHYLEGTTDVTRTFVLGELTEDMKYHYTLVLKGHLNLLSSVFKEGCSGLNLDYIARKPIWDAGLDYNHGTGHGVGYLMNVHEGPQAIRHRKTPGRQEDTPFKVGMITSNEPGLYFPGKYGIRLENLMLCVEKERNDYGTFLGFKVLTLCPFEASAINVSQLNNEELRTLNEYHSLVYNTLSPYLNKDEKKWLKCVTNPL